MFLPIWILFVKCPYWLLLWLKQIWCSLQTPFLFSLVWKVGAFVTNLPLSKHTQKVYFVTWLPLYFLLFVLNCHQAIIDWCTKYLCIFSEMWKCALSPCPTVDWHFWQAQFLLFIFPLLILPLLCISVHHFQSHLCSQNFRLERFVLSSYGLICCWWPTEHIHLITTHLRRREDWTLVSIEGRLVKCNFWLINKRQWPASWAITGLFAATRVCSISLPFQL